MSELKFAGGLVDGIEVTSVIPPGKVTTPDVVLPTPDEAAKALSVACVSSNV
jgi:hypothetical protein